jgi:predicted heme/steroid binding protein/uncharacterized membrane protein
MKEIDAETLSKSDGKEGNPVYIAYKGRVIDVSKSKLWQTGVHMGRHTAGRDLTAKIAAAPHGPEVLDRYPEIGFTKVRAQAERPLPAFPTREERPMPAVLARLLSRYPFFRRHPHPATVHFPIAFMAAASGFYVLYLVTGAASFEVTAVHCLGAGIFFTLLAMGTGLFTCWLNYMAKPVRQVTIKIVLSCIMLPDAVAAFVWRLSDPGILNQFQGIGAVYLFLVLATGPLALAIGYIGGTLTFPLEKK